MSGANLIPQLYNSTTMAKDTPVVINKTPEVSRLEVEPAFAKLTTREKIYAHYSAKYVDLARLLVVTFETMLTRSTIQSSMERYSHHSRPDFTGINLDL